jgi:hypothetical protein
MSSVTRFGSHPGVLIDTYGTPVSGVTIGEEEKYLLFGEGNVAEGDASVGEAVKAETSRSIDREFGSDTQLSNGIRKARENSANPNFTHGVVVRSNWSENESFSSTASGTLANAPLFGLDKNGDDVDSYVRFYDKDNDVELNTNFVDDSGTTVSSPANSDTVNIGVTSGNWEADASSDYEVTYQYFENETGGGSQSGTLASAPLIEDKDRIRVFDTTGAFLEGTELTVEYSYDDSVTAPSDADTIRINPVTGEWYADAVATDTYQFYYVSKDFENTFDDVDGTIQEEETGLYAPITRSNAVSASLDTKVNDLREKYKLVQGVTAFQPNDTTDDEKPIYDVEGNLSNNIDNDAVYRFAPSDNDSFESVLPAISGSMVGADITEPVYNDRIQGVDTLAQQLSIDEREILRNEHRVIPLKETNDISIEGNISTSTATDYARTFFVRRIVDRVILLSKVLGDEIIGSKNTEGSRRDLEDTITEALEDLVADKVLQANGDERNWYVEVTETSFNEVSVEVGVTPVGVIKRIDQEIIIDTTA